MKTLLLLMCSVGGLIAQGCGDPQWQSGRESFKLEHNIQDVGIEGDRLLVKGWIVPIVAVSDYGVRVNEARDDTGKSLAFRSFEICYAKGMWFCLELDAPDPKATRVSLDLSFASRSGLQRIRETLPIKGESQRGFSLFRLSRGSTSSRPVP